MNDPAGLANRECKPSSTETTALHGEQLKELSGQLGEGWTLVDDHHLEKNYSFEDFQQALDFTNRVGKIAEKENHHPDVFLSWGKVELKLWTHSIHGLSENDYILAAKADAAYAPPGVQGVKT